MAESDDRKKALKAAADAAREQLRKVHAEEEEVERMQEDVRRVEAAIAAAESEAATSIGDAFQKRDARLTALATERQRLEARSTAASARAKTYGDSVAAIGKELGAGGSLDDAGAGAGSIQELNGDVDAALGGVDRQKLLDAAEAKKSELEKLDEQERAAVTAAEAALATKEQDLAAKAESLSKLESALGGLAREARDSLERAVESKGRARAALVDPEGAAEAVLYQKRMQDEIARLKKPVAPLADPPALGATNASSSRDSLQVKWKQAADAYTAAIQAVEKAEGDLLTVRVAAAQKRLEAEFQRVREFSLLVEAAQEALENTAPAPAPARP